MYWFAHTPAKIDLDQNGKTATLTLGEAIMQVCIIAPAKARFSISPAQPLPTSPNPAGIKKNEGINRLTIALKEVKPKGLWLNSVDLAAQKP